MKQEKLVLVVEDNGLIAVQLKSILEREGFRVLGPCPSLERAFELVSHNHSIQLALLDINLDDDQDVYPLARRLRELNVPFLFVTGYNSGKAIKEEFRDVLVVEKPFDHGALSLEMKKLLS